MILLRFQRRDRGLSEMGVETSATAIMQGAQWLRRGSIRSFVVLDDERIIHRQRADDLRDRLRDDRMGDAA